jgi:two-component system chemotaxis response regulator CheY
MTKNTYDVVLLDIMLQDESGIDILKKIKEQNKDQKVVMLTNLDVPAVINEAYENGADGYLLKSELLPSQVASEIKRFL